MRTAARILIAVSLLGVSPGCSREQRAADPPATSPHPAAQTSPVQETADVLTAFPHVFPTTSPGILDVEPGEARPPVQPPATREAGSSEVSGFMPLRDAVVGHKASYVDRDGRTLHYEIVDIAFGRVLTQVSVFDETGRPIGQPALRRDGREDDLLSRQAARVQAARTAQAVQIEAAGRAWSATLYEDRWVDEEVPYVRRSWVSPDVPVFGLIRMELIGDGRLEAKLELQADHQPGPQEKPP